MHGHTWMQLNVLFLMNACLHDPCIHQYVLTEMHMPATEHQFTFALWSSICIAYNELLHCLVSLNMLREVPENLPGPVAKLSCSTKSALTGGLEAIQWVAWFQLPTCWQWHQLRYTPGRIKMAEVLYLFGCNQFYWGPASLTYSTCLLRQHQALKSYIK